MEVKRRVLMNKTGSIKCVLDLILNRADRLVEVRFTFNNECRMVDGSGLT